MAPSKKEIAQWASGAASADANAAYDQDDELNPNRPTDQEAAAAATPTGKFLASRSDDWATELEQLIPLVRSPKTNQRVEALQHCVPSDAVYIETSKQRAQLLLLLADAGLRYDDTRSLKLSLAAASPLFDTLFRSASTDSDPVAAQAIKALLHQLGHAKGAAPRSRSALIHWLAMVLQTLVGAGPARVPGFSPSLPPTEPVPPRTAEAKEAVLLLARALDALQADGTAKPGIKQGVLTPVRRALRASHEHFALILDTLLQQTGPAAVTSLSLLGTLVDVALRLRAGSEPVKGLFDGKGHQFVATSKDRILAFFTTHIVSSKAPVSSHALSAVHDFFLTSVQLDDLVVPGGFKPTLDKMMLRSPEIASPVASAVYTFLPSCSEQDHEKFGKQLDGLRGPLTSALRSTTAVTRERAVTLAGVLLPKVTSRSVTAYVQEVASQLKANKFTSTEARSAALETVSVAPSDPATSPVAVQAAIAVLDKESNEAVCRNAWTVMNSHLSVLLDGDSVPSEGSNAAKTMAKHLQNAKAPLRHAACESVGDFIWTKAPALPTGAWNAFVELLVPAWKANLVAAGSGLKAPAGPVEGYVVLTLLKGRLLAWETPGVKELLRQEVVTSWADATKPSFVLNDKVIRKVTTDEERAWQLRALLVLAQTESATPEILSSLSLALSQVVTSHSSTARSTASEWLTALGNTNISLAAKVFNTAAVGALKIQHATPAAAPSSDEDIGPDASAAFKPLFRVFTSLANAEAIPMEQRQEAFEQLFVLAHLYSQGARNEARALALGLHIDLSELINEHFESLWHAVHGLEQEPALTKVAFASLTTMVSIAPETSLAEIVSELEEELDTSRFANLTGDDLAIWATPPGEMYHDVLVTQGKPAPPKGGAKVEQWEQDLRNELARKKAAAKKFTREEQKLIDQQLAKEAEIRTYVELARESLVRSLRIVQAIVAGQSEELASYILGLTKQVLALASISAVHTLAPFVCFDMLSALNPIVSSRLGPTAAVFPAALLRTVNDEIVPESFRYEVYNEMVLRILYRMRVLTEQNPLDLATVSLLTPLLSAIILRGGLSLPETDEDGEPLKADEQENAALEQVQLALDIIGYHTGQCDDPRWPRSDFIAALLHVVAKHTQLAKEAVSALRSMGEAMASSSLPDEVKALLRHTLADEVYVRTGALQALQFLDLTMTEVGFPYPLWLCAHDTDEENARLAEQALDENELEIPEDFSSSLLALLEHPNEFPRVRGPYALAGAVEDHPESVHSVVDNLMDLYRERAKILEPEYDHYGMVIPGTENREDPWRIRQAIAVSFTQLAPLLDAGEVVPFIDFMIRDQSLGDRSEAVRVAMLDAATAVIDDHGAAHLDTLMKLLQTHLDTVAGQAADGVTEAVVVLLGRLARHLEPSDKRLNETVDKLMDALHTPSELVQSAVADCLPALIQASPVRAATLVDKLFTELVAGASYATRRGAAYGIAGVIKGRGISSIPEFNLMERLSDAASSSKNQYRQGAMMAYETLIASLKILFEPYLLDILPQLLSCFGDHNNDVREATQDAARAIMQNISGHCVKLILPDLLMGLDDKQWRSKKGAVELLGAMAYCAPRQLSNSLPKIIPPLSEVLSDSHTQVKTSANRSLKQFGEVIDNPEIRKLSNRLLQALINPNDNTAKALKAVLNTSFVHYIDSASLALLMPIVERGLKERAAGMQSDATRIVGNLAGLTDSRDFIPYTKQLMPQLRTVLVNPVPETRAVAARSLGTLVERLGEANFIDLVPSLLVVLRSDASGVDRQGAAQGLAEILAGLGTERMENLLPEIIQSAASGRAYVRAGYISLLIYLPATFGSRFAPHLAKIIPPILGGIADSTDTVRDASMRAGRMIIANYSQRAVELLLPEMERGMFDEEWRIRMSSIQLVGDLLFRLSGISGKAELSDEHNDEFEDAEANEEIAAAAGGNSVNKALIEALGAERRDKVLSAIYLVRQDPYMPVRQQAVHTWKALIINTPRTAREILPTMLDMIIGLLSSPGVEQRLIAGQTLGELVRKLGERILRDTIPLLRNRGVTSDEIHVRAGVCYAVNEILTHSTKTQLEDHEDTIIAVVRHGLVDASEVVRHSAAKAFDTAQEILGAKAIDDTIPTLLEAMSDPENPGAGTALAALREIMRARAEVVFPVLVPTLTQQPITGYNARALTALVSVAGRALNQVLSNILTALALTIEKNGKDMPAEERESLQEAVRANLASVGDGEGLHQLMLTLLGWAGNSSPARRTTGCSFMASFAGVMQPHLSLEDYQVLWLRKLLSLFEDPVEEVVAAAREALEAVIKTVPKTEIETIVVPVRNIVESLGDKVSGFSRPKGIAPLVPVFLAGLLNGTAEQREQGAYGLADLVQRTDAVHVKTYIIQMVGPLIRACGDRHTPAVKQAILQALTVILDRVPALCRPFYPQLQRSFQKALNDPASSTVRTRAAEGLGTLMLYQPRVDPVVAELIQTIHQGLGTAATDQQLIAESSATALISVLEKAPAKNVTIKSWIQVAELGQAAFGDEREPLKPLIGDLVGLVAASPVAEEGEVSSLLQSILQEDVLNPVDATLAAHVVRGLVQRAPERFFELSKSEHRALLVLLLQWMGQGSSVARAAREARDAMHQKAPWKHDAFVQEHL